MKPPLCLLTIAIVLLNSVMAPADDEAVNTSSLVYPGPDGALVYEAYSNRGQSLPVNTLPDFSRSGYRGGGEPIPYVPAAVTLSPSAGADDTARIQGAIDWVASRPVAASGLRGAVLLKAGDYRVSSTLSLSASGVVLRGEGAQERGGTRIILTATAQDNLIEVTGGNSYPREVDGTRVAITEGYVPVGAKSFTVASAAAYRAGDRIIIHRKTNDRWITDLGMDAYGWEASSYQMYYERSVTAVVGDTIHVDAPVLQAIEDRYGGGDIFQYTMSRLRNVGIESLRLESTFTSADDEEHGWNAIVLARVEDAWVRQVTARHFGQSCVTVGAFGHRITIEDCAQLDPKSRIEGGRRYSFYLDDCSQVLVQRCYARGGRHDFASGSLTPGPNAFVDCLASRSHADIGPHHRYATGQIYDNVRSESPARTVGGEVNVHNRRDAGSGHGWAGAQILFWNCEATSLICDAPRGAMNWSIGCRGDHHQTRFPPPEPDGIWDSHGIGVTPRSLYYAQLEDRLGEGASRYARLPSQEDGDIWPSLRTWAGDGLFRPDQVLVAGLDQSVQYPERALLKGAFRDLYRLDNGATITWSVISGPAHVFFGDAHALETTVVFGEAGTYRLRLTVDDGAAPVSDDVTIAVLGDGWQLPGDCNQDGSVNISDPLCLLGFLFVGSTASLPCGDGSIHDEANRALLDTDGDGRIDLSDAISMVRFLFIGGPPPRGGLDCRRVPGCADVCRP